MINSVYLLKEEHREMVSLFDELERFANKGDFSELKHAFKSLKQLGDLWNKHEKREEELFDLSRQMGKPFPNEAMLVQEHKEFRGHWKVLNDAMNSEDPEQFCISLDTDGRMLIEKFRKHIKREEEFFDKL